MQLIEWLKLNNIDMLNELIDNDINIEYNSMKLKLRWKCKNGHIYYAEPRRRTIENRGCPYCAGKAVSDDYNSLYKTRPDLAAEWDYEANGGITPHNITAGSNKYAYWICKKGHKWKAIIANRSLRGSGCPYCNNGSQTSYMEQLIYTLVLNTFDDALNRYKINGIEYDIYIPSIKVAIEYNGRLYHAKEFNDNADNRAALKFDNAKTNGIILININETYNDLNIKTIQNNIYIGTNNVGVKRQKAIELLTGALENVLKTNGINIKLHTDNIISDTNSRIELKETTDSLGSMYPDLSQEWCIEKNGNITPFMVKPQSNKPVYWKCKDCGHIWLTSPAHRVTDGTGCPACIVRNGRMGGSHITLAGVNDLKTLRPDIFSQIDLELNSNIDVEKLSIKSNKPIWWKCKSCNGSWQAPTSRRVDYNSGCPYCSNRKVLKGFNDLRTVNSRAAYEFELCNNIPSDTIIAFSNKRVNWKCSNCGGIWESPISDRVKKNRKCPYCGI